MKNFKIGLLQGSEEKAYEDYLLQSPESLFFASIAYRNFLREFLNEKDLYLIAKDDNGMICGALPVFMKSNRVHGNILNSLPFYGSNGGIIEHNGDQSIREGLLKAFYELSAENNCVAATIVSSPLKPEESFYEEHSQFDLKDTRIGQLSQLPPLSDGSPEETIFKLIHYKMRNLVRKAQKLNIRVEEGSDPEYLEFLMNVHKENMLAIGGISKPEHFFTLISSHFKYGSDYKVYVAKKDDLPIAALLLFYYNKTVEYYTPVIKAEYRSSQPLSLIIFEAMKQAIEGGYNWWNWGGTWISQGGVYHFKSQWGTSDKNYYYYTRIYDPLILSLSKEQLLENYPYFFVAPFSALKASIES